ncbi:hypothetical protein ACET3Z_031356 [Daucus carota]
MFADSGISSSISNSRLKNLRVSGRINKNAQSYITPSQRRLQNVEFPSPSQCFTSSTLINRNTGSKVKNTRCVNLLDRHTPAKTASQGEGKGTDVALTSGTRAKTIVCLSNTPVNNVAEDETITESEDSEEAGRGQDIAHDESDSRFEFPCVLYFIVCKLQ